MPRLGGCWAGNHTGRMWGVCGAILSTPMLAIVKIVCDRIDALKPVGHFMGGNPHFGAEARDAEAEA